MANHPGIDAGRFGVFLLLTANRLGDDLFKVGAVAIGTVAFITAMVGFLIAAGSELED